MSYEEPRPDNPVKTIFVSIASYRDPQLVPTIEDCIEKAAHPERLHFGICWQHGSDEGPLPWLDDARFRIIDVDWKASRGVCWARAEIMKRFGGEAYYLQLDSHHRFAHSWDEAAIAELEQTGSSKAILTAYATPFDPERPDERSHVPMQMDFDRFTDEAIALFRPAELHGWQHRDRPARARFLSAHFLFTIGDFVREVPYDPELYFIGEEITLTVRAFTHGYDLFHPTRPLVWHEYTREYRPHKHWTDHVSAPGVDVPWHERDQDSLAKVRRFLELPDGGPFGLGSARTLSSYEAFADVSFQHRKAQEYTKHGEEPPTPPAPADWAERIAHYSLELAIEKARLSVDVDDYLFWYVGVHDASGHEIHREDLDRAHVQAAMQDASPCALIRRDFHSDREPATWTVWPVSASRGWLDRIDGPVLPRDQPSRLAIFMEIGP